MEQFDAKPAEIRQLLRGDLDPRRSQELMDEMRAAGLPTLVSVNVRRAGRSHVRLTDRALILKQRASDTLSSLS